jgi:hypothetical protein
MRDSKWWRIKVKKYIVVLFMIASCVELALGILKECDFELSGARFVLWGSLLIYLLMMCCNSYTKKELALFAVLMCMGVALYVSSGINMGIKAPIYVFALKGVDCKRLFRWITLTFVATLAVIFVADFLFGFGTSFIYDPRLDRGIDTKRYSFGFIHPNVTQLELFAAMTFVLCLSKFKINIHIRIIVAILYGITCYLTDSRSGMLIGIFVYVMSIVLEYVKWDKWKDVLLVGIYLSIASFIVISVLAAAQVRGGIIDDINLFISGRMNQLLLCNNSEECLTGVIENWKPFASKLHKNMYDMGYAQLFYYYGYVSAVCYLAFICYSVYVAWRDNEVTEMIALWGFATYLFMEARYFSNYLTHDYLLMTAAYIVMRKGSGYEKKVVSRGI